MPPFDRISLFVEMSFFLLTLTDALFPHSFQSRTASRSFISSFFSVTFLFRSAFYACLVCLGGVEGFFAKIQDVKKLCQEVSDFRGSLMDFAVMNWWIFIDFFPLRGLK
ncbi:hypothetical protein LINPERPRIM_LOCUS11041 [Linum perenne]